MIIRNLIYGSFGLPMYLVYDSNATYAFQYRFWYHIFTFECMYSKGLHVWMSTLALGFQEGE